MTEDNKLIIHTITNARLIEISVVEEAVNPYTYIREYNAIPEDMVVDQEAWKKANEAIYTGMLEASLAARKEQEEKEKPFRKAPNHIPKRIKGNFEGL